MNSWTDTLECTFQCGAKIEITARSKSHADANSAAEALGWATFDLPPVAGRRKKKRPEDVDGVVCPECIEKVRAIYHQVVPREL